MSSSSLMADRRRAIASAVRIPEVLGKRRDRRPSVLKSLHGKVTETAGPCWMHRALFAVKVHLPASSEGGFDRIIVHHEEVGHDPHDGFCWHLEPPGEQGQVAVQADTALWGIDSIASARLLKGTSK